MYVLLFLLSKTDLIIIYIILTLTNTLNYTLNEIMQLNEDCSLI